MKNILVIFIFLSFNANAQNMSWFWPAAAGTAIGYGIAKIQEPHVIYIQPMQPQVVYIQEPYQQLPCPKETYPAYKQEWANISGRGVLVEKFIGCVK